jgi:hypothetical protein
MGNLLIEIPSNKSNPLSVPIHRFPFLSSCKALIKFPERPLSVLKISVLKPSLRARPPPPVPSQIKPLVSWIIEYIEACGIPSEMEYC